MGHHLGLSLASWEDKGHVDLPSQSTAFRPLHFKFSASMNKKQVTIHKLYQEETNVAMILTQRSSNG